MPSKKRRDSNLAYISKFTYPNVGEFEIKYNKDQKRFQVWVDEELISAPTEDELRTAAKEYLERTAKLDWKQFIVIDKGTIGYSTLSDNWGDGPMVHDNSFRLQFWRVEIALSREPKKGRVCRRFPDDKHDDDHDWTEHDEKRWATGTGARSLHESEDYIFLDYSAEIWDTLLRMEQALSRQRDALQKLLKAKNLEKLLLVQRASLPALPAPKRRRRV